MQPLRHDRLRGLAVIGGLLGFLLLPAALGGGGGPAVVRVSVNSAGVQGNGESIQPSLSAKGRLVAFQSGVSNLVPGDTNGTGDVFLHDLKQATTARASVDSTGGQANSPSFDPSISGNGRSLAFKSFASNLVPGDTNGEGDIFVRR
ncbi:MAG: hypothetical protein L0323_07945 [Planctomycetes bacterium]|nr:hypothetical protein [Planctomycetota bacterium]